MKEQTQNSISSGISNAIEYDELSDQVHDDQQVTPRRLSTGITELDDILHGGFIPWRTYLVRGGPGSGKTTLGLHFLTAGAERNEATLYVSVGEPEKHIQKSAQSIGLDMSNIAFLDLSMHSEFFAELQNQRAYDPVSTQQESITRKIIQQIEVLKPQRVFLDSMTQLRLLLPDIFQFRGGKGCVGEHCDRLRESVLSS